VAVAALPVGTAPAAEWVAGDLHVHTTYSHDSYGGPEDDNTGPDELYTLGHSVASQFAIAASRGLDYLAITDHNDVRSQSAPGFGSIGVVGIPAYEASLRGHGQMLGTRRVHDHGSASLADVQRLLSELHAEGGLLQANHPSDPLWAYGYDLRVDAVEAWNLPWYYQSPFPSNSDNEKALRYWQGWADRGERVALTAGSDNHWVSTTAAQGAGQPTTWVYARERTVPGVLEGIREGRTFVSHQPPNYAGTQIFLSADASANGRFESIVGDTVPPGSHMRAIVVNGAGGFLNLFTDRGTRALGPIPITSDRFEYRFRLPRSATWAQAQVYGEDVPQGRAAGCSLVAGADLAEQSTYCTNRVAMLAMTSAIFFRPAGSRPVGRGPGAVVPG
jgi:hypothetical protein